MKVRRYLGLKTEIHCDRCHGKIPFTFYALCRDCFMVDPRKIRRHQIRLPYQHQVDGNICCLCKKAINNMVPNHVCYQCISQHDDETHSGWYINSEFENGTILYRSCGCGSAVKITVGDSDKFEYYRIGSKIPTLNSFQCSKQYSRESISCFHDWIVLGRDVKSRAEGKRTYYEYRSNIGVQLMGLDNEELEHLAYGSTKYWCYKCGLYYDLSPQKEKLLPMKGYID